MKKILLGALAVIVVVAGCAAAAHLKALQPRAIPASPPLTIPETVAIRQPAFQRGIDVDAYTYPRHDFSAAAAAVVAYARSLNANSLSISFPFFMSGRYSSRVFASSRTPTPTELALFIIDAERAGLYVSLRPLLSEANIGSGSSSSAPSSPGSASLRAGTASTVRWRRSSTVNWPIPTTTRGACRGRAGAGWRSRPSTPTIRSTRRSCAAGSPSIGTCPRTRS